MLKRCWMVGAIVLGAGSAVALAQVPAAAAPKADAPKVEAPKPATPAADLPSGKEVLERAIAASGGRERLSKLKSRVSTGTMEIPAQGLKASIVLTQVAPNNIAMVMEVPGMGKVQQGFNGTLGWEVNPMAGARLLTGEELQTFIRGSTLSSELRYAEDYKSFTTIGTEEVAGKPAIQVRMVPNVGGESTMVFDKESGLLVKMSGTIKTQMGEIPTVTLMEDYREVDGMKLPFRSRVQVVGMGVEQVIAFEKIEHDGEIAADVMTPPEQVKKLAEKAAPAPAAPAGEKPGEKPAEPAPGKGG